MHHPVLDLVVILNKYMNDVLGPFHTYRAFRRTSYGVRQSTVLSSLITLMSMGRFHTYRATPWTAKRRVRSPWKAKRRGRREQCLG